MKNKKINTLKIMSEQKRFLHLYETTAEFEAEYNNEETYHEPWVSYVRENSAVTFNKPEEEDLRNIPLTFEITSDGNITWSCQDFEEYITAGHDIQYKKNDGEWTNMPRTLSVVAGDTVQFRGDNATYTWDDGLRFDSFMERTSCGFKLKGNIMSLIVSTGFATATTLESEHTFYNLFAGCDGLVSAKNLVLPATTLSSRCYETMFQGCTSLTETPELPATTLASSCYSGMFEGCTSLTQAPELPATTLADYCYNTMFVGCTSLNYVKCLATDISAADCTYLWLDSVASSGTFVKAANMSDWEGGESGIPVGWTVQDA